MITANLEVMIPDGWAIVRSGKMKAGDCMLCASGWLMRTRAESRRGLLGSVSCVNTIVIRRFDKNVPEAPPCCTHLHKVWDYKMLMHRVGSNNRKGVE